MGYMIFYIILGALVGILILIIICGCIIKKKFMKSDRISLYKSDEEAIKEFNVIYDKQKYGTEKEESVPLHSNLGHVKKARVQRAHQQPKTKKALQGSPSSYWINLKEVDDSDESTTASNVVIGISYLLKTRKLHVNIKQAHNVVYTGKSTACRFYVSLIPNLLTECKTKKRRGDHPIFNEKFDFDITTDDIKLIGVKLSFYLYKGSKPTTFACEAGVFLDGMVYNECTVRRVFLEQTADMDSQLLMEGDKGCDDEDDNISTISIQQFKAEILTALSYDKDLETLTLEIRMIHDLPKIKAGKPNSFVKVTLTNSSNRVLFKKRSGTKMFDVNPIFEETFFCTIPYSELASVTLAICVFAKGRIKEEMIGWLSYGLSSSGLKAKKHWDGMMGKLKRVEQWHELIDPND